ncbi:hypothetical protein [Salininema proteolyticum]|uniref:DUF4351 domain-containing protein n=1 Tax=Salininema proteolyticum TaxID=1607685 RepID=A0ABV8TX82_9ACTN
MAMESYPYESRLLNEREKRGEQRGKKHGEAIGLLKGIRQSLIRYCEIRDVALTDDDLRKIAECDDPRQLERWQVAAFQATSRNEIFGP